MKALNTKTTPGSIFYIPALSREGQIGFVLARHIERVEPNAGVLIEVFSKFYSSPPKQLADVDMSQRLFRPILCSLRFAEIPRWKVLFEDPHYERSQSAYGDITIEYHNELWVGGTTLGKAVADYGFSSGPEALEWSTCWRMHHIVFRVNACLSGYFAAEAPYDNCRLPEHMRVGNEQASDAVIALARQVEERFKGWSRIWKTGRRGAELDAK